MERNDLLAVTAEMLSAARDNPRGWVEKIETEASLPSRPRVEIVVGAWKVDASGEFTGQVILNPRYRPLP
jgi:hypothetical protein